jgi:hypothetical protein
MGRPLKKLPPVRPPRQYPWDSFGLKWHWLSTLQKTFVISGSLVLIAAIVLAVIFLPQLFQKKNENDIHVILNEVQLHYLLPANETPALATVTDASKLSAAFLKDAKTGDKVLIYQSNHLVIIYRPSIDRIISVGPVSIDVPQGASQTK